MATFGYTVMGEQAGPKQLVHDAVRAEEAGFDFIAASDHYSPWLAEQGHAPYTWTVLGAIAQATEQIELMTYVTCPTDAVQEFLDAGFTQVALVQIGGEHQDQFLDWASAELLPALRKLG